jgi:hypothetical protein
MGDDSDESVAPLAASAKTNLAKWLAMVAKSDLRELPSIIAHEAVYHSPVEWHPYPGHDLVCLLVRTAAGVFEDFKYLRVFTGGAPIRKKLSGSAKSLALNPSIGAPNFASAANTALLFSASAPIKISRSFVARGCA